MPRRLPKRWMEAQAHVEAHDEDGVLVKETDVVALMALIKSQVRSDYTLSDLIQHYFREPTIKMVQLHIERDLVYGSVTRDIAYYRLAETFPEAPAPQDRGPSRRMQLEQIVSDALETDGMHHKQWYLCKIAELLNIPVRDGLDRGIAP